MQRREAVAGKFIEVSYSTEAVQNKGGRRKVITDEQMLIYFMLKELGACHDAKLVLRGWKAAPTIAFSTLSAFLPEVYSEQMTAAYIAVEALVLAQRAGAAKGLLFDLWYRVECLAINAIKDHFFHTATEVQKRKYQQLYRELEAARYEYNLKHAGDDDD